LAARGRIGFPALDGLVSEELFQILAGLGLPGILASWRNELAPNQIEIFTVIGEMFFSDFIRASIPALISNFRVIADTV
jgi:hypothetical protein